MNEDVKGLPKYVALVPQGSNPIASRPGLYLDTNGELVLSYVSGSLQITDSGEIAVEIPDADTLTSASNVTVFIDSDDSSTDASFTIYKDVTTATGGEEVFRVNEDGSVEFFAGPLVGGTTTTAFSLESNVEDDDAAVGFNFEVLDTLVTEGATLLQAAHAGGATIQHKVGEEFWGGDGAVTQLNTLDGSPRMQLIAGSSFAGLAIAQGQPFYMGLNTDWDYPGGHTTINIGLEPAEAQDQLYISLSRAEIGNSPCLLRMHQDATTSRADLHADNIMVKLDNSTAEAHAYRVLEGTNLLFGLSATGAVSVKHNSIADSDGSDSRTLIGVINTAAPRTVTLLTADCVSGRVVIIKDESGGAGTNNITIDTQGSELIDGASSVAIIADYGVVRLYSNGSNWFSF